MRCRSTIEPSPEVAALQPGFRAERRGCRVDRADRAHSVARSCSSSTTHSGRTRRRRSCCRHRAQLPRARLADAGLAAQRRHGLSPRPRHRVADRPDDHGRHPPPHRARHAKLRRCARTTSTKWYAAPAVTRCSRPRSCARRATWVARRCAAVARSDAGRADRCARRRRAQLLRYASVLGRAFPRAVLEADRASHGGDPSTSRR